MSSNFVTNLLHSVFLTTSFFTTLLSLAKSSGTGVVLQCVFYLLLFLNLLDLFLMRNYLHLHVSHFLDQFLLHNCSDLIPL